MWGTGGGADKGRARVALLPRNQKLWKGKRNPGLERFSAGWCGKMGVGRCGEKSRGSTCKGLAASWWFSMEIGTSAICPDTGYSG